MLSCSGGKVKTVRDCYALRSLPCASASTPNAAALAARIGRQPAHSDAPEPRPKGEGGGGRGGEGNKPTVDTLDDVDVPLSAMLAIQPGTCLWIYPDGCGGVGGGGADGAELVWLEVGEMLIWRGDLVHAGAGYAREHVRVHTYVDPPADIFERRRGQTNLCSPTN